MHSEKEKEFLGFHVQNLFQSNMIHHFVPQNEVKVNYSERAIKNRAGKKKYTSTLHIYINNHAVILIHFKILFRLITQVYTNPRKWQ